MIIAQYYGAKDEEKMQWAVHTSMMLSIIGGILQAVSYTHLDVYKRQELIRENE